MHIPHFVYRLYDATDALIYVGMTGSVALRMKQHRKDKPWWSDVARMEVDQCASQAGAAALERSLIVEHDPVNNTVFASKRNRPAPRPISIGPKRAHGRPKSTNAMGKPLQIRMTIEDKAELAADAHAAGFANLSDYVRFTLLPEHLR